MMLRLCLGMAALLVWTLPAAAHESRPSYLAIDEVETGRYEVVWKRPARGERTLGLSVVWPVSCAELVPGRLHAVPGATVERRVVDCGTAGLTGQRIAIDGLAGTLTDALVRIEFLDGTVQSNLLKPAAPWLEVSGPRPPLQVGAEYFALGVEHILLGIDHLLFVLGLTLIVRDARLLVKTITGFTVAHSMTLAGVTLGWVSLPSAPVEAVIAMSILFLASELSRQRPPDEGLTARYPWLVALVFGLLHGFGFAGALAEVGLPQADVPLALLAFNLGVEVGQLAFVAAVLALAWTGRLLLATPPRWLVQMPAYGIGSMAAFWLIDRVAAF